MAKHKTAFAIRTAIILLPLLFVGCLHEKPLSVKTGTYKAPRLQRELNFFVSNYSSHETNHFYVGPTEVSHGKLISAWVYWKEERTLLTYAEPDSDTPEGAEAFAWTHHFDLKLDRDTVDTPDDINGSTYLETHRQWVDWMEQCVKKGKSYCVLKTAARKIFPKSPDNADWTPE